MARRKKKGSTGASSISSSSSSGTNLSGSTNTKLSGSKNVSLSGSTGVKPKLQKQLETSPRRGGGGFRGTFFQANRPQASRARSAAGRTPRTASGRTFDEAARARIAAAQAGRALGSGAGGGDIFEILIKTYAEARRDELADAFLDILIEEIPVGETGVLVDSAHIEDTFETAYTAGARVVVDAPYTQFVNDGSDAVVNKLMVWESGDEVVFATSRDAIPPNPFWDRALARWSEAVARVDAG